MYVRSGDRPWLFVDNFHRNIMHKWLVIAGGGAGRRRAYEQAVVLPQRVFVHAFLHLHQSRGRLSRSLETRRVRGRETLTNQDLRKRVLTRSAQEGDCLEDFWQSAAAVFETVSLDWPLFATLCGRGKIQNDSYCFSKVYTSVHWLVLDRISAPRSRAGFPNPTPSRKRRPSPKNIGRSRRKRPGAPVSCLRLKRLQPDLVVLDTLLASEDICLTTSRLFVTIGLYPRGF